MENISAVYDEQGNVGHYVALMSDITKSKEHEFNLEHSAHFDMLTNLPNRVLLADRLEQAIAQARRRNETLAVAFIDLDGFKSINDEHGHLAGDQFLIAVSSNLTQVLREVDTLARLGGDEFIALLVGFNDTESSATLFTRLLAAAALPVPFEHALLQVSASMGVTFYPQAEEVDADLLIRQADQAMYQAKLTGKNRYHLFDIALDKLTRSQNETLESIRVALAAGEFELYYQPKVNLRLGKVVGAEALIRWQHPTKGLLAPAEFLPLIENHALSVEMGEWVIDAAMSQIESWHKIGLSLPISVNISAKQLQQDGFIECLRQLLKAHPTVKKGDLELEILETSAMRDLPKASQLIADSRDIGILFSLDDFGTGYSSLTYLKRLPINQLKIDQSFVRDMLNDVDDLAIVEGVLALAAAFSLEVIAEGMETTDHGEMLLQLGCDLAQGYGIARPMPAAALENWITTWQPDPNWVDRPSFTRADLPLLFAHAEYKVWFKGVEDYLFNKGTKPEISDSRFGLWLANNSPVKQGNYETMLTLHRTLHALAEKLIKLNEKGQSQEAQQGLAALRQQYEVLQDKLKSLVEENWK
jgi:diguanylate cyclase (GGDEF)-like protein